MKRGEDTWGSSVRMENGMKECMDRMGRLASSMSQNFAQLGRRIE